MFARCEPQFSQKRTGAPGGEPNPDGAPRPPPPDVGRIGGNPADVDEAPAGDRDGVRPMDGGAPRVLLPPAVRGGVVREVGAPIPPMPPPGAR